MTLSGCIGTYLILVLCSFCRTFLCLKCKESVSSEEVFLDKSCLRELQKLLIVCECDFFCPLDDWEVGQ